MAKKVLLIVSIFFALLFLLTSWMWTYYLNLILSFPLALISYALLLKYHKNYGASSGTKLILWMLLAGILISLFALVLFL